MLGECWRSADVSIVRRRLYGSRQLSLLLLLVGGQAVMASRSGPACLLVLVPSPPPPLVLEEAARAPEQEQDHGTAVSAAVAAARPQWRPRRRPPSLPSYSTPALTANLVLRVLLAAVANAACLVPLRLLCRRGELAAVELLNLETAACALLWRDDVSAWWPGLGFCDADAFVHNAATGIYASCLLAVMRSLALRVALAVANILTRPRLQPYSYHSVHHDAAPLPWNSVTFRPSSTLSWASLNICYIPVFLFFGMTKDALDQYRAIGLFLGLGTLFPRLRDEYDPERGPASGTSFHSSHTSSRSRGAASKISSSTSSRHLDSLRSFSTGSSQGPDVRAIDFSFAADLGRGRGGSVQRPEPSFLLTSRTDDIPRDSAHSRNPFLFRTSLALPIPFRLPVWEFRAREGPEPEPPVIPQGRSKR